MNVCSINEVGGIIAPNPSVTIVALQTQKVGAVSSLASLAAEVRQQLGEAWLPQIYREQILTKQTRAYHLELPAKQGNAEVQYTLLGVELKIGRRRVMCPDLATARYLSVFARTGNADFAVPYDISQLSRLADELEFAWHRMLLLIDNVAATRSASFCTRLRRTLVAAARDEIAAAGAGADRPHFNQNTKQRRA